MRAWYTGTFEEFLAAEVEALVGELTLRAAGEGYYQMHLSQAESFEDEIAILREAVGELARQRRGSILLEYPIPRRGKRTDAIVLMGDVIVVLEFKCGATKYLATDRAQVEDYALDLADFHEPSHGQTIVPVLVASVAAEAEFPPLWRGKVNEVLCANKHNLAKRLEGIAQACGNEKKTLDVAAWSEGRYLPTPTIIEAAQCLYAGHNVREITRSHAGTENLAQTAEAVLRAVREAAQEKKKVICFVTGVPGAGKTLAGLNIVHNPTLHEGDLGVFLSGNGPLVKVLQEALALDHAERTRTRRGKARGRVKTFVQNVHHFIKEYYGQQERVPVDQLIVFDEAQRAWDLDQVRRKWKRSHSEPETLLEIMDRHADWAVIVGLIGGGQEINTGEAGLSEWGRALLERFEHWEVRVSPALACGDGIAGGDTLFEKIPESIRIVEDPSLHLNVSVRSYRAEKLSDFVAAVLDGEVELARKIFTEHLSGYPIFLTRELGCAKQWLRDKQRGTRRVGLLASSGARRLKAHGIGVTERLAVEHWFLRPWDDVRSSFYLEEVATEFDIQGLEIDWCGVCWGADLRLGKKGFGYYRFHGNQWQAMRSSTKRRFLLNKYRVLLTRAREGMVIWVSQGDERDQTRRAEYYDRTANYLKACGIEEL